MPLGRPLYEHTTETRVAGHRRTLERLKARVYRPGPWQYATPTGPAPTPSDIGDSADSADFTNGWQNVALPDGTWSPLRWRFSHDGRVELVGAIDGGALGSVCVTLPADYRPAENVTAAVSSTDGSRVMTVSINATSGDVTVVGIPAASADVGDGQVGSTQLADGSVTTPKIADGSVTTPKIADGAVTGAKLEDDGVTAGTYGDASHVPQITVDSKGRVTDATDVAITGGGGGITDLASPGGTIDVTNPTGPTADIDLPASGVTAGTYGDGSHVAEVTVDAEGRVTAAASVSIVAGGAVVGSDGWVDDTAETWTFASFTAGPPAIGTFTVPGDLRAKYTVGTRIKLTQTTVKFFVVSADPTYDGTNTTVTITGGTDYTLANAAISLNYHSYIANPQGYPGSFNFAAAAAGFSSKTSDGGTFSVNGRVCFVTPDIIGTSNSGAFTWIAPIAAATTVFNPVLLSNNSLTVIGRIFMPAGGTTVTAGATPSGSGGFTASGTKSQNGSTFFYQI